MADPISEYLQSRNITDADTVTRLRNAFASNPDILERRMLAGGKRSGARGVEDTFDQMIEATLPEGKVTVGTPEKINDNVAPAPTNPRPSIKGAGEPGGTKLKAGESRQLNYDSPGVPGDPKKETDYGPPNSGSILEWLLPAILGLGAARNPLPSGEAAVGPRGVTPYVGPEATYVGPMPRNDPRFGGYLQGQKYLPDEFDNAAAQERAFWEDTIRERNQQKYGSNITDQRGNARVGTTNMPNQESVGSEIDQINNKNATMKSAREAQIRQDVADENAQMLRAMEEQERVRRAQRATRETVDAAKRVTGRR